MNRLLLGFIIIMFNSYLIVSIPVKANHTIFDISYNANNNMLDNIIFYGIMIEFLSVIIFLYFFIL